MVLIGFTVWTPVLFCDTFQTIYANKVEVQDYKLLCLARVQVIDQKMTLVGILGGWWAVPSSQGVLSELRTSLRNKVFSLQHSFKVVKFIQWKSCYSVIFTLSNNFFHCSEITWHVFWVHQILICGLRLNF